MSVRVVLVRVVPIISTQRPGGRSAGTHNPLYCARASSRLPNQAGAAAQFVPPAGANRALLFSGLGYGMLVITFLIVCYYNLIIAWTIFYTAASFTSELGWSTCTNE